MSFRINNGSGREQCLKRFFRGLLQMKSDGIGRRAVVESNFSQFEVISGFFQKDLSVVQAAFHKASFPLSAREW